VSRTRKEKLVVASTCRGCGEPRKLEEGVVASSSYGACCSKSRRAIAAGYLGLRPITPADFEGPYLVRSGR